MDGNSPLAIVLAVLFILAAVFYFVISLRDLRNLLKMPEWTSWSRTARTLGLQDRRKVYFATLFGRRFRDPRLARLAVQRGEAALAVVHRAHEEKLFGYWYRLPFLLAAGTVLAPLFLLGAVGSSLQQDWLGTAWKLLLAVTLVPYWLVVDWSSERTTKSIKRNRRRVSGERDLETQE